MACKHPECEDVFEGYICLRALLEFRYPRMDKDPTPVDRYVYFGEDVGDEDIEEDY